MRTAISLFLVPALALAQQPHPRLGVDALRHDFGRVERDSRTTHRFKLTNTGDAPLKILHIRPSCGCTTTALGKDLLAPGESTELEATFNATGIRGRSMKSIEVASDDPGEPNRVLLLEAEVREDIRVRPEEVVFRDLAPGDRRKATVKLESTTSQPIHVEDVEMSEAPWLGVATREKGQDVFVDLELAAHSLPSAKLSGTDTLTLHLVNPRASIIQLPVRWEKRQPVYATPARVALAGEAGKDLIARVVLRTRLRKPFRVVGSRTTSSFLEVLDLPKGASTRQELRVKFVGKAPAGIYDDRILLDLEDAAAPSLEIRVATVVNEKAPTR